MRLSSIILVIILIIAFVLRIQGVITNSFAFTYDVGRDLLALQEITQGKIPLIGPTTGLPGLFYGPWWYYLLTPAFLVSHGNPQGIAFFMAALGIVTIIVGYLFAKKLGGEIFALLFAAYLSFSPTIVGLATQIWSPNIVPILMVIIFYLLYQMYFLNTKKYRIFSPIFIGFLCGLIMDSGIVFGTIFIMGFVLSITIFLHQRTKIQQYALFLVGLLAVLFPRIIFEIRHDFLMSRMLLSFVSKILSGLGHGSGSVSIVDRFFTLGKLWNDTVALGNGIVGIVLFIISLVVVIRVYKISTKAQQFFIKFSVLILIVFLIGLSFFPGDVWGHYIVGLPVFYIFLLSFAVFQIYAANFFPRKLVVMVILLLLILNLNPAQVLKNLANPYWEGDASLYRNQISVVDYVYKKANKQQFNYAVYTPPIHDYPYQYIFLWYGKNTYGYVPTKDKASLFFLIMEPDKQYPSRLEAWYKIRENDGKVIENKKLPGDISVETRKH